MSVLLALSQCLLPANIVVQQDAASLSLAVMMQRFLRENKNENKTRHHELTLSVSRRRNVCYSLGERAVEDGEEVFTDCDQKKKCSRLKTT